MATVSKFYLLDASSPNTGTMPSGALLQPAGTVSATGEASGARTVRDATDVAGSSNPDTKSTITSNADVSLQTWGHRRFVSRPLAARTFANADGTWSFSYARQESNLNHNQNITWLVYAWRPSTGLPVTTPSNTAGTGLNGNAPTVASTEQAEVRTDTWGATSVTILDGDILVFDICTSFIQSMSTAYTESFSYNGTTEASTTTCASFITPPVALTLFTGSAPADMLDLFNPIPFLK